MQRGRIGFQVDHLVHRCPSLVRKNSLALMRLDVLLLHRVKVGGEGPVSLHGGRSESFTSLF